MTDRPKPLHERTPHFRVPSAEEPMSDGKERMDSTIARVLMVLVEHLDGGAAYRATQELRRLGNAADTDSAAYIFGSVADVIEGGYERAASEMENGTQS